MHRNELSQREFISLKRYNYRELTRGEMESLTRNIYLSIEGELEASAYYQALADIAPNPFAREIILEFSQDEREHAYQLQQAYEALTGRTYMPPGEMEYEFEIDDYIKALEKRVLAETADLKKYKDYYLMTSNPVLRNIFFNAMHDETYHAIREMYLIHMEMMRRMMMGDNQNESITKMQEMMVNMMDMMENMMNMMCEMNQSNIQTKNKNKENKKTE